MNELIDEIKELIIKSLNLEDMKPSDIDENAPLFNEGLGLDSVDALELGLAVQKSYGLVLDSKTANLKEIFEIEEAKITPQTRIYEDLQIDSIDAIDLIDHIKRKTGHRLMPEDFKNVKTLEDIVNAVAKKFDEQA